MKKEGEELGEGKEEKRRKEGREFPGHAVFRTLRFRCRGHGFGPWSGNKDPACRAAKKKKTKKTRNVIIMIIIY